MSAKTIVRLVIPTYLLLLLLPAAAWAQTAASGTIAGVVRDTSGAVLPGVSVVRSRTAR